MSTLNWIWLLLFCVLSAFLLQLRHYGAVRILRNPLPRSVHEARTGSDAVASYVSSLAGERKWNVSLVRIPGVRLGNHLFRLASLYGIARQNGRHLRLTPRLKRQVSAVFPGVLPLSVDYTGDGEKYLKLHEEGFAMYTDSFYHLPQRNIVIDGYLQSWKYFSDYEKEIRALLKFKPEVIDAALRVFGKLLRMLVSSTNVTFVGVHVRRGDTVGRSHLRLPGRDYVINAMTYFRSQFIDVHFIVCSDDAGWCESNFGGLPNVTVSKGNTPEVDLAILSRCRHSIITWGSFGWWGAWMAGGQVVYFPTVSAEGSARAKHFAKEDYFLPNWISMSD